MATGTDVQPLIRTKLYRPRITGNLVPRPHLLEHLEGRRDRPLTLVSAPAGYGKTTLVSNWLDSCDCPSAWLSLDQDDDDLCLFLTYLLAAIETMFPGAATETWPLLQAASLPPQPALARSLINELDRIERPFILVLDDYHHIHSIAVHDLLTELLAHPPRPMHLVLISRNDPLLNLARLRARRQVTEIRARELRLTEEETAAFLQQEMGAPIDDGAVSALQQRVEGWVTGLRLMTLSLRQGGSVDLTPIRFGGSVSLVTEYLTAEVLDSLPQAIQDYLLNTAILERFCAPLCEVLQFGSAGLPTLSEGKDDSAETVPALSGQAFVEWLEENDPFLVRLDDRGEWHRYHPLFREVLRGRLEQQLGAEGVALLHRRASTWFAQNGRVDEALHHALAAGDTPTAVGLVAQYRHDLINREQWQHLERWLRLFDRTTIDQSPELSIIEAWLLNHLALIQQELEALDRSDQLLLETDLAPTVADPIRGEALLLRANLLGWQNRPAEALAMIEPARSLLLQEWQYAHAAVSMVCGFGYAQLGDPELAVRSVLADLNNHRIGDSPMHKALLLYTLASVRWTSLDLQGLKQDAARYGEYGRRFDLPETQMVAQHFLGCAHYHQNELREAEKQFRSAASNPYRGNRSFYTQAVCGLAFTYRAMGRHTEAQELLGQIHSDLMDQLGPLPLGTLQAGQAEVALAQGDIAGAIRWAEVYDPQPVAGLQMFFIPQLALVKVLLAQNTAASLNRAAALLTEFLDLARKNHFQSALLYALPLQAILDDLQGREAAALSNLEEAVHLAEDEGLVRVFVDLGPQMASLLERLGQRRVAADDIAHILAAFETTDAGRQTTEEGGAVVRRRSSMVGGPLSTPAGDRTGGLVDPLTPRELEILALLAQGLSNKEIAAQLVITPGTVKQHTHNIYRKLNVKKRWQAVTEATALGILLNSH